MFACLGAALAGIRMQGAGQISVAARTVLGVAVGASITPTILGQVPLMAFTLALVPIYVVLIGLVGVPFFQRICGFDRVTSYYAAMPGGFSGHGLVRARGRRRPARPVVNSCHACFGDRQPCTAASGGAVRRGAGPPNRRSGP